MRVVGLAGGVQGKDKSCGTKGKCGSRKREVVGEGRKAEDEAQLERWR